ncbi:MAG TPA: hypothetical protein VGI74_16400 [Streptosporangiaceae bacterium]|jgi:hypothetical protein
MFDIVMGGVHEVNGVQRYTPDEALSLICGKLETAGLQVRKLCHGDKLTEVEVTNPASAERGDMSINHDGFVTWEHMAPIVDDKGIGEIVDVMKVLLAVTTPSEMSDHENQPPSALRQEC